jgi:hypothetical protein
MTNAEKEALKSYEDLLSSNTATGKSITSALEKLDRAKRLQ